MKNLSQLNSDRHYCTISKQPPSQEQHPKGSGMKCLQIILGCLLLLLSTTISADENADSGQETVEIAAKDVKLVVPKSWKQQEPSSQFRVAQFEIPAQEEGVDPVEVAVFPPLGGSIDDNIQRWIGQFGGEGRSVKKMKGESQHGKYVWVHLTGTYNKPDGPPILQRTKPVPDYGMVGVILATEKGNYYLKMTGPQASIEPQLDPFRKSFGGNKETEEPYGTNGSK